MSRAFIFMYGRCEITIEQINNSTGTVHSELLDRGLEDILQLDEMASVARRHLGGSPSEDEVMRVTTEIIGELVDAGYAIVGDVAKDDEGILYISSWGLGSADTIKRIEDEWRALGRPPNLGDVCWLELTESGRAHALDVYRPRYRIDRGLLQVWFSGGRSVNRPSFDCLLNVTDAGGLLGSRFLIAGGSWRMYPFRRLVLMVRFSGHTMRSATYSLFVSDGLVGWSRRTRQVGHESMAKGRSCTYRSRSGMRSPLMIAT